MTGSLHRDQFVLCRNQLKGRLDLLDAAEWITRTVNKQARRGQVGQVLRAKLVWLKRRMQWIGEQQQPRNEIVLLSTQHRGLTTSVGVSAKKYLLVFALPAHDLSHGGNSVVQARPIALGIAGEWRPKTPLLPKRKIAAQNRVTVSAKSFGERDKKWCVAIAARAMRQDQSTAARIVRRVHPAAYVRINILVEK